MLILKKDGAIRFFVIFYFEEACFLTLILYPIYISHTVAAAVYPANATDHLYLTCGTLRILCGRGVKLFIENCNKSYSVLSLGYSIHCLELTATTYKNELIERCRLGDERAQMQVYDKYYHAMYNTAFRIVKHSAEAEDVMQEAFLKAFRKLDSFKGDSTFGAWLKKIVVNESIGAFHKKVRKNETTYNDELKNVEDDGLGYFEEDDGTNPKVKQLLGAMNTLKDNYRIILNLHLIEGYDYEEICGIMNITNANCRTTISRAKESLRKKLTP